MSPYDGNHISRGEITVPTDAKAGTFRLRVRNIYFGPAEGDPCGSYFGEVEDYSVEILNVTPDFAVGADEVCVNTEVQFSNTSLGVNDPVDFSEDVLFDTSPNSNSGSLEGFDEPYIDAGFNGALHFDGIDDYVELPTGLTANLDDFTFEAWYFYEEPRNWQRIMDFGTSTSNFMMLTPTNNQGRPQFEMRLPYEIIVSPDPLTPGNWYHFAVVISGNNKRAKLYINGELKGERSITNLPSDLGILDKNYLGKSQWPDPYLKGFLEEVRIWRTARSQAEIEMYRFQELLGNEEGLLAYYNCNGIPLIDNSPNSNFGTLQAFEEPYVKHPGFGEALNFDGMGAYVELPAGLTAELSDFTFESLYFYEEASLWQRIMEFGTTTSNLMTLTPTNADGKPQFEMRSPYEILVGPEALETGKWYHFAVVINESARTAKLYIDGQLKGERSITNLPSDLGILDKNWLGKSQFEIPTLHGQLDEVRIWSTARTQAEIQMYKDQELSGSEEGLLIYYNANRSKSPFTWSFEGGTPSMSSAENPIVSFTEAGNYTVNLTVDQDGQTHTSSQTINVQACKVDAPDWPVVETDESHMIILEGTIPSEFEGRALQPGDFVGVFFEKDGVMTCAGKAQWTGGDILLAAYGDDATTSEKDGFLEGETFQWKVWLADNATEYNAVATYKDPENDISHTDTYAMDGMSQVISLMSETNTGISSLDEIGIRVFPNPSKGNFNLELPQDMRTAQVKVYNYAGQLVLQTELKGQLKEKIDLQKHVNGVYMIQIQSEDRVALGRLLLRK